MAHDGVAATQARGGFLVDTQRGADALAVSLMFIFVTGAVTLSLMPVVTTELRDSVGLSNAQIGLLTTVFLGFYGVSGISSGIGAARWGGRLLAVSSGCFVVGSLIFGLSSGFGGFLVGRAIQGIGGGMVIATCSPVMAEALPPERLGRAWGILGSGWGLGTVGALLVMPGIQNWGGYRAVFLATAGFALVVGLAAWSQKAVRVLPRHPEGATTPRGLARALSAVVSNRKVVLLGFTNTAALAIGVGVLVWTPSFLQDVHLSAESISVYVVASLGAAQLFGNVAGAAAMKRWSKLAVIVASVFLLTGGTVLLGVASGVAFTFVMLVFVGFFSMFFFPPMIGYMPEIVARPEQVGPATGINSAMGFVGSEIAPWIFGRFLDVGGKSSRAYLAGYLMLAAFGAAALIGLAFFKEWKKRA